MSIRVALYEESNGKESLWVARCMDFNLTAQASTIELAKKGFVDTLLTRQFLQLRPGDASMSKPEAKLSFKIGFSRLSEPESVTT